MIPSASERQRLLVTAFEPFGGETVNASALALEALPTQIGPWTVGKRLLPVLFGRAGELAARAAEETAAAAVVCLGQAAGRTELTPELVALNWQWARLPDHAGLLPQDTPVVPGAREAYFSTLPLRSMTAAITAAGLPARLSTSAGTYVCNDLYYRLLHRFHGTAVGVGFIHLPPTPAQTPDGLATEAAVRGLCAAIAAIGP